MAREAGLSTQYDRSKVLVIIVIGAIVVGGAVTWLYINRVQTSGLFGFQTPTNANGNDANTPSDSNQTNGTPQAPSPTPVIVISLPQPTLIPTLSPDEKTQYLNQFEQMGIPEEGMQELREQLKNR